MYGQRKIEARPFNHCCTNKYHIYSDWPKAILSSVACPALQYFCTLSHKRHYFQGGGGKLLNMKCAFWFSLQVLSETFLILKRIQRGMIINVKYSLFLSDTNETWHFSTDRRKVLIIKFHENPSSGSRLVPCGRTDRQDEANSRKLQVHVTVHH